MKKLLFISIVFLINFEAFPQAQIETYLEGAMVTSIKQQGNFIWIATYGQGIYRYSVKEQNWFNYSTKNQNAETDFFYSIALNNNYLWAGTVEGLYIYDLKREQWRKRKFAQGGELGNWIRTLCYDPSQNVLWIGRFKNLTRLDVRRNRYTDIDLTENGDSKTNNFKTIKLDGDSLIWFGTESGVHIYQKKMDYENKSAWRFVNNKSNAFNNDGDAVSISDILFVDENIWFGTDEFITEDQPRFNIGGIYKFDRNLSWDRISKLNGLASNGIYCLARTGNRIWAGVYSFIGKDKKEYGRGIALVDRNSEMAIQLEMNSINFNAMKVQTFYFDGTAMWIGTEDGLYKINIDNPLAHWGAGKLLKKNNISPNPKR